MFSTDNHFEVSVSISLLLQNMPLLVERFSLCSLPIITLKLVCQSHYCYKICPCFQHLYHPFNKLSFLLKVEEMRKTLAKLESEKKRQAQLLNNLKVEKTDFMAEIDKLRTELEEKNKEIDDLEMKR